MGKLLEACCSVLALEVVSNKERREMGRGIITGFVILFLMANLSVITATPAIAQEARLSLTPNHGAVGQLVEVKGEDFIADAPITFTYDGTAVITTPKTPRTGKRGWSNEGKFTLWFRVPASTVGAHIIRVSDGVKSAEATFSVEPKVKLFPTSGLKDTRVTVTGTGFAPNIGVDVLFNNEIITTAVTNGQGSFSTTFTATKTGVVSAVDGAGNRAIYTANFSMKATLTLEPTAGYICSKVRAKGINYPPSAKDVESVTFAGMMFTEVDAEDKLMPGRFYVEDMDPDTAGRQEVKDGEFKLSFLVPANATLGTKLVRIKTDQGGTATARFTIKPRSLTISPSKGPIGTPVLVKGIGFPPGEKVTLQLVHNSSILRTLEVTASSEGSFAATVNIEGEQSGENLIKAVDIYNTKSSATFTVLPPQITVSPARSSPGTEVKVEGIGFPSYSKVTIKFLDSDVSLDEAKEMNLAQATGNELVDVSPIPSILTDAQGHFSTKINVPGLALDTYPLWVGAGGQYTAKAFTIIRRVLTMAEQLFTISGKYEAIWGVEAPTQEWRVYAPSMPEISDLTLLEKGKGYWIKVKKDCTLVWEANSWHLYKGWNLIGWGALSPTEEVPKALASIAGKYEVVWGFDSKEQRWLVYIPGEPEASDLTKLERGEGYWIKVKEDCTLSYGNVERKLYKGWNLIGW